MILCESLWVSIMLPPHGKSFQKKKFPDGLQETRMDFLRQLLSIPVSGWRKAFITTAALSSHLHPLTFQYHSTTTNTMPCEHKVCSCDRQWQTSTISASDWGLLRSGSGLWSWPLSTTSRSHHSWDTGCKNPLIVEGSLCLQWCPTGQRVMRDVRTSSRL